MRTYKDLNDLHEQILIQIELAALRTREKCKEWGENSAPFDFFANQVHAFAVELHQKD